MKKLLALILCLSMTLGAVAFADETELTNGVFEGQTKVSLTINPEDNEFVVVIPATVEIDPATKQGSFDVVLKAGWSLPSSNGLRVRFKEFANGIASGTYCFTLKNTAGEAANYRLFKSGAQAWVPPKSWTTYDLISVAKTSSNKGDITATWIIHVDQLPTTPGEYTDTITFVVELY